MTEIVQTLGGLMQIGFIANNSAFDAKLAKMPYGDRLQIKEPLDSNPEQSRREASYLAQKVFLLICDFINAPIDNDKDLKYIKQTAPHYINLLATTVLSIPKFNKVQTEPYSEKMFKKALERIAELEWYDITRNIIACWTQIFQANTSNITTYTFKFADWSMPNVCSEILTLKGCSQKESPKEDLDIPNK